MTGRKWIAMALASAIPSLGISQAWVPLQDVTSAELAFLGWELQGSAATSMPDGREAIVTFWVGEGSDEGEEVTITVRCLALFDSSFQQISEVCAQGGGAGN